MILSDSADWDAEALKLLLNYKAGPKQLWDNTDFIQLLPDHCCLRLLPAASQR